jgi:hypothetical protein
LTSISICPAFWKVFLAREVGWLRTWARQGGDQPRWLNLQLHGQTANREGDRKRKLTFLTLLRHQLWGKNEIRLLEDDNES